MKYDINDSNGIVARIIELTETTDLSIVKICDSVGITKESYYAWKKQYPDFSDQLKVATLKRLDEMARVARESAFKKIQGYEVEEQTTTYESGVDKEGNIVPVIKERKVTKKHIVPSDTLIMYALNNTDPEHFKHKEHFDHTSKGDKIDYRDWNTEELVKRAKAIAEIDNGADK